MTEEEPWGFWSRLGAGFTILCFGSVALFLVGVILFALYQMVGWKLIPGAVALGVASYLVGTAFDKWGW